MLAAKSFEPTSDISDVERWVGILAEELADRMVADNKQFNRRPRSLHLQYRSVLVFQVHHAALHVQDCLPDGVCAALTRMALHHAQLLPGVTFNTSVHSCAFCQTTADPWLPRHSMCCRQSSQSKAWQVAHIALSPHIAQVYCVSSQLMHASSLPQQTTQMLCWATCTSVDFAYDDLLVVPISRHGCITCTSTQW